jgi:DNA-binding MarR family transcriptional regulator
MQLLRTETKRESGNNAAAAEVDACVDAVLNVTPPVVRAIRKMMREHRLPELSVPQFRTMALLSYSAKACLSNVADFIGSSLPAASRMIDGLVAKNLVARTTCTDDRRQIALELTPLGRKLFLESRQATRHQLAAHLSTLSPEQKQSIVTALGWLAEIFGTDAEAAARAIADAKNGNSRNGGSENGNGDSENANL